MTQGPRGRCLIRARQSRCLTLCNGSAAIPHALGGVVLFVGVCGVIVAALSDTVTSSGAHCSAVFVFVFAQRVRGLFCIVPLDLSLRRCA